MQSRYRGPREGFRPGPSAISAARISSYGRDLDHAPPNPYPFHRKIDILMEAGRLAAEYLVSRGVIPAENLKRKFPNGSPPGFERQPREIPPLQEVRTSALARLGQRFDDEERFDFRRREKSRKRPGAYSRVYDSDWGRDNGKSRNWMDKGRDYSYLVEEDDEFAPGFGRHRRKGYTEIKSSVSRVSVDEQPARSESASEKENYELADDTWSKASSSSTKKDHQPEADEGSSKGVDEVKVSSFEITTEEAKGERSVQPGKQCALEVNMDKIPCEEEGNVDMKDCNDFLKLCILTKVPTKPRSSLANKSLKVHHDPDTEMSIVQNDAADEEFKDFNCDDIGSSKVQTPENHKHQSDKCMEEEALSQPELFRSQLDIANCTESLLEKHDFGFKRDIHERKSKDDSTPSWEPTIDHNESVLLDRNNSQVEEIVQETNGKYMNLPAFSPKAKKELNVMLEEGVHHEKSASFKICDLNLNGSPEMGEFSAVPSIESNHSAPNSEMINGVLTDINMQMRNTANTHNKAIPLIGLEDAHTEEVNTFDSSKHHRNDISYGLENVLNQETNSDGLPIQDGYGLEFSEFLVTDISGCPSAQGGLNGIQPEMGLHGAEDLLVHK